MALSAVMLSVGLCGCTTKSGSGNNASSAINFTEAKEGDKIAVITVKDFGTIKVRLFTAEAPAAAQNFIDLANKGYYDGLIFHRVIEGFVDQGGDPEGTGRGGEAANGGKFDGGITPNAYHFSGAIAYANAGTAAENGSQFYLVNTDAASVTEDLMPMIEKYFYQAFGIKYSFPDDVKKLYIEYGGTPSLDVPQAQGGYTIFGQTIEGLDVVQAIGKVETDEQSGRPVNDVVIESIKIEDYHAVG